MSSDDLYSKVFTILLTLRDTRDQFRTYSATDIKTLIKRALEAKTKDPKPMRDLYELETMIRDLRNSLLNERTVKLGEIVLP
jgi:hypothetical protein